MSSPEVNIRQPCGRRRRRASAERSAAACTSSRLGIDLHLCAMHNHVKKRHTRASSPVQHLDPLSPLLGFLSQQVQAAPLFQALLEAAPDAIVIVDQEGRIVLVNRQAEQLFGYERQELLGQEIEILIPERLRAVHRRHRTSYLADPRTRPMGVGLFHQRPNRMGVGHDRDDIWG
jgi:PAS domain-containing protein